MSRPIVLRLITLGDSGVGKSSLLLRYTQDEFMLEFTPTIGIDFRLKTIQINGKSVKVQIWDTAGQERFRTITHNYYRGAQGIVLVFDLTNRQSFDNVGKWMKDIQMYSDSQPAMILVGTKCDVSEEKREVTLDEAKKLADKLNTQFFATSAKSDLQVNEAFSCLVQQILKRNGLLSKANDSIVSEDENRVRLSDDKTKKLSSCCSG